MDNRIICGILGSILALLFVRAIKTRRLTGRYWHGPILMEERPVYFSISLGIMAVFAAIFLAVATGIVPPEYSDCILKKSSNRNNNCPLRSH